VPAVIVYWIVAPVTAGIVADVVAGRVPARETAAVSPGRF